MDQERKKRSRATCVVEIPSPDGPSVLVAREKGAKSRVLPGGWIRKDESAVDAAKRALLKETGADALTAVHLFDYESARTRHKVVLLVPAGGELQAQEGIEELTKLAHSGGNLREHELWPSLHRTMQAILERYLAAK